MGKLSPSSAIQYAKAGWSKDLLASNLASKTSVTFVNGDTQPTVTVKRGTKFEVLVPQGYELVNGQSAKASPVKTTPVPARGGSKDIPAGELKRFILQAQESGNLTFVKKANTGRGGTLIFPLVVE